MNSHCDWNEFFTVASILKAFILPQPSCFHTTRIIFSSCRQVWCTKPYDVHVGFHSAGLRSLWSNSWLTAKGLKWYLLPPQSNINALREANTTYVFSAASVFIYPLASFLVLFCDPLYSAEVKMNNNIVTYIYIYIFIDTRLSAKPQRQAQLCRGIVIYIAEDLLE